MLRFCSSRLLLAPPLCGRVLVAGALLVMPLGARAQEQKAQTAPLAAPEAQAQSEAAFWADQEVLSAAQRPSLERTSELLRVIPHPRSDEAFEQLRAQEVAGTGHSAGELELLDPAQAVAFYGAFLSNSKDTSSQGVELQARISSLAAQLFATSLNQPRKALEVYDWSIALLQPSGNPLWMRLAVERDHLIRQMRGEETTTQPVQLGALPPAARVGAVAVPLAVTLGAVTSPVGVAPSMATVAAVNPSILSPIASVQGTKAAPDAVALTVAPVVPSSQGVAPEGVTLTTHTASATSGVAPARVLPGAVQIGEGLGAPITRSQRATPEVVRVASVARAPEVKPVGVPGVVALGTIAAGVGARASAPMVASVNPFAMPVASTKGTARVAPDAVTALQAFVPAVKGRSTAESVNTVSVLPGLGVGALPRSQSTIASATLGALPLHAAGGGSVTAPLVALNVSNARRDAALAQIKAGTITPEEAWQSGALTEANVRDYFQFDANIWIIHALENDHDLNLALESLLVERGQTAWAKLSTAQLHQEPRQVRLWVGDYFVRQHNADVAVPILESILDEYKVPVADAAGHAMLHQAAERIAWMQRDAGNLVGAAKTFERPSQMMADTHNATAASTLLEAARLYAQAGQNDKADQAYAIVLKSDDAWCESLARHDLASNLIRSGGYERASQFLQDVSIENQSVDVKVSTLAMLAFCQYRLGRFKTAHDNAEAALNVYKMAGFRMDSPNGIQMYANMVTQCLHYMDKWASSPLVCELSQPVKDKTTHTSSYTLLIRTQDQVWCDVSPSDNRINVEGRDNNATDQQYYFEKKVSFRIDPSSLKNVSKIFIVVSSSNLTTQNIEIPIRSYPD